MEKVIIESFTLDHTKVIAPYVRLIGEEQGEHGDIVSNFDVRLAQPKQRRNPYRGHAYLRASFGPLSTPSHQRIS